MNPALRAQLQQVDDPDGLLLLAIIDDPVLSEPIYVVNDTRDWLIGGQNYIGMPMEITFPDDVAGQASSAQAEFTNTGRELTAEFERLPIGTVLDVTLRIVSRVRPEDLEWDYTATITRATATVQRFVIVMGDDALFRQSAVLFRFDPTTAPGLFAG